jgi:hypothetical protein
MPTPDHKPKKNELIRAILDFVFGFKNNRGEILDAWIYSAEGLSLSGPDFYASVEKRLEGQKIPNLEVARVEFAQGGLLSNQRQYLRLMRERLAIDTCAAPFGSHFFFSCRTVYVPALVRLWHILAMILFFAVVGGGLVSLLGFNFAVIAMVTLPFAMVAVFRNASASPFADLDTLLLKIPVVATVYENWFRVETYYRVDTRTLYRTILPDLIRAVAEEVSAEKGVKLVKQFPTAPLLMQLYSPLA